MGRKQSDSNDIIELWVAYDGRRPLDLEAQIQQVREKGKLVVVCRSGRNNLAE